MTLGNLGLKLSVMTQYGIHLINNTDGIIEKL